MALTVVTGPPCSGKTTYVHEHAKPGDIIIDLDPIAEALGSPDHHDHPEPLRRVAQAARRAAIAEAIRQHRRGASVWIVECDPTRDRRAEYHRASAQFISLRVSVDELHRRAADRPRLWHALIDRQVAKTERW